ncbi:MAG: putative metal-binding motif-containing protein, partial [Polyangiaceae bacterium]
MVAAFRCPGPDPLGGPDPEVGGGGAGAAPSFGGNEGVGGQDDCPNDDDVDDDQDGFIEGDCDDCDPDIHPDAAELGTLAGDEPVDENCNGMIDEHLECEPLEDGLGLPAVQAARAMDVCNPSDPAVWGLQEARLTRFGGMTADTSNNVQMSVAKQFGTMLGPQVGERMLVLSTGHAVDLSHPNACLGVTCGLDNSGSNAPSGFPVAPPGCANTNALFDDIALEVTVVAPPNAGGFRFHTLYLTHEYPLAVCSAFRDQFVA